MNKEYLDEFVDKVVRLNNEHKIMRMAINRKDKQIEQLNKIIIKLKKK
jgi:hypothetical protein